MKLRQGQVWDLGGQYVRIVVLERLAVEYKAMKDLKTKEGTHQRATKKQFCALVKNATLLPVTATAATASTTRPRFTSQNPNDRKAPNHGTH